MIRLQAADCAVLAIIMTACPGRSFSPRGIFSLAFIPYLIIDQVGSTIGQEHRRYEPTA